MPIIENKNADLYYKKTEAKTGIRIAFLLLAASIAIGILGFTILEGYSFSEAFYMTIITLSTVGFTEVKPLSEAGRIFASFYIIGNIGIYAYSATAFSKYIIEGEIFKNRFLKKMDKKIKALDNHVIVCGLGKYGREIIQYFDRQNQTYVIIEQSEDAIKKVSDTTQHLLWLIGDATDDKVLQQANIKKAKSIIAATGDDSENMFIVLSARQLSPKIDIISRAIAKRSEKKMYLAGADHVIMPDQIGGFYMAVLVNKPDVVDFFSFIANETNTNIGFEEIHYCDFSDKKKGKRLRDLEIRTRAGANVIGLRKKDGTYEANPSPETILQEGESFIVLGNKNQINRLQECFVD